MSAGAASVAEAPLVALPARVYVAVPLSARARVDAEGLAVLHGHQAHPDAEEARAAVSGSEPLEIWQLSTHSLPAGALTSSNEGWTIVAGDSSLLLVERAPGPSGPFYHVADARDRESILAHGLDYRRGRRDRTPYPTKGNFVLDCELSLVKAIGEMWVDGAFDVWQVDLDPAALVQDCSAAWRESSWLSREPFAPEALRLVASHPRRSF